MTREHSPGGEARRSDVVERLAADYAEVSLDALVRIYVAAHESVTLFGELDGDAPALAERIARQDLDFLTGRAEEIARLNPEHRRPRSAPFSDAAAEA